jgi:hypothetical protein
LLWAGVDPGDFCRRAVRNCPDQEWLKQPIVGASPGQECPVKNGEPLSAQKGSPHRRQGRPENLGKS